MAQVSQLSPELARGLLALARGVIQYAQRGTAGTAISVALIGVCAIIALRGSLRPELALSFLLGMATVPILALHLIGASVVPSTYNR